MRPESSIEDRITVDTLDGTSHDIVITIEGDKDETQFNVSMHNDEYILSNQSQTNYGDFYDSIDISKSFAALHGRPKAA